MTGATIDMTEWPGLNSAFAKFFADKPIIFCYRTFMGNLRWRCQGQGKVGMGRTVAEAYGHWDRHDTPDTYLEECREPA
jgi:hypothetical protein